MKITPIYFKWGAFVMALFIFGGLYFFHHKTNKVQLSCSAPIQLITNRGDEKNTKIFVLRMFFDNKNQGVASFDGNYYDRNNAVSRIARYLVFHYEYHDGHLLITDAKLHKNVSDNAPDDVIAFSETEFTEIEFLSDKAILMRSTNPAFVCNLH